MKAGQLVPIRESAWPDLDALPDLTQHPVQWHSYPMQHSVHPREVADISAFLARVLAPAH